MLTDEEEEVARAVSRAEGRASHALVPSGNGDRRCKSLMLMCAAGLVGFIGGVLGVKKCQRDWNKDKPKEAPPHGEPTP